MEEKIFYLPGDIVTLKQNIPNKPIMIVVKKETSMFRKEGEEGILKGIRCRWFTQQNAIQEAVFNTKDLLKIED